MATMSSSTEAMESSSAPKPKHRAKAKPSGILKNSHESSSPAQNTPMFTFGDGNNQSTTQAGPCSTGSAAVANSKSSASPQSCGSDSRKRKSRGIKWDENTLAEHDKERGTRMRIQEPKTPYEARRNSSK